MAPKSTDLFEQITLTRRRVLGGMAGLSMLPETELTPVNTQNRQQREQDTVAQADYVVRTTEELLALFPAEKNSSATVLSDGDTVYISSENAPYRPQRDLRIHSLKNLSVLGSGRTILIRPAPENSDDGTGSFVITGESDQILFDGLGFDGNRDELEEKATPNQNLRNWATPFVTDWTADNVTVQNCHIQNTFPRGHNQGGTALIFKSPTRWVEKGDANAGHRVLNCTFSGVGDRSIRCGEVNQVVAAFNRATAGFDRMITLAGTQQAYIAGNVAVDLAEGSAFGANDGEHRKASTLTFNGNWGVGRMFNLFTFEGTKGYGVEDVFCYGNHRIPLPPDSRDSDDPESRNTIHQQGKGKNHIYLMNYGEYNSESGYEIRFDNTRLDWNIEKEPGKYGIELADFTAPNGDRESVRQKDCKIGHNNVIIDPGRNLSDSSQPDGSLDEGDARYYTGNAIRPRIGGMAIAEGDAETPGASWFEPGEVVRWTDTGDGNNSGIYLLDFNNSLWHKIA